MEKKKLAEQFHNLFSGLTIAHGKMQLKETFKGSGKQEAYHSNAKEPVTIESWIGHLEGKSIGIVPIRDDGSSAIFGAIDIDSYQGFSFNNLLAKIHAMDLPLVVCRSKSGGAHCYLFLTDPVPAEIIHKTLREWSAAIGYATNLRGEPTEIFPKQVKLLIEKGDVGSFINMPYADYKQTKRYGMIQIAGDLKELTAEEFLRYAETKKITIEQLTDIVIPKAPEFMDGPPCLEMLAKTGVEEGGRNVALFNFGVYARKAFPDSWEDKIEDYNRKFIQPALSSKEVTNTIKAVGRKEYEYTCKQSPICNYCIKSDCISRKFGVGTDVGEAPVLDTIVKINTDPPTYILNMLDRSGKPIPVMLTADELLSARKIKLKCLQILNYLPFIPKQQDWEKQVQKVMERVTVVDVPEDSSASGQLMHHLNTYLSKKARSNSRSEILNGKPFIEEGKIYFRMVDLCAYLEQNHFKHFKPNEMAAQFRKHQEKGEMGHRSFNVNGKCVQTWWVHKDRAEDPELQVPEEMNQNNVY